MQLWRCINPNALGIDKARRNELRGRGNRSIDFDLDLKATPAPIESGAKQTSLHRTGPGPHVALRRTQAALWPIVQLLIGRIDAQIFLVPAVANAGVIAIAGRIVPECGVDAKLIERVKHTG